MKHKILIFGTGNAANKFLEKSDDEDIKKVVGFIDNATKKWGTKFYGKLIFPPDEIKNLDYTQIIICSIYYREIKQQLKELGIPDKKVKQYLLEFNCSRIKQVVMLNDTLKGLKNKDFTLISNYCWGAFIYNFLDLKYNSPFIGTFILNLFYDKLLQNFEYYIKQPLKLKHNDAYNCIEGNLDDISILFFHDKDPKMIIEKWHRRLERINLDNLFIHWGKIENIDTVDFLEKYDFKNKLSICDDMAFIHSKEKTIITKDPIDLVRWFNQKL